VKDGYVPQDEQPVYVSKGRQIVPERPQYPVGMSAADAKGGFSVGYFDIGNYTPTTAIPGLNFVESSSGDGVVGTKSKSKKSKNKGQQQEGSTTLSTSSSSKQQGQSMTATSTSTSGGNEATSKSQPQVDPVKRLRNLKKRLKEIDDLEKKIMAGDLKNPEKEQVWNEYQFKMNMLQLENTYM